MRHSRGWRPSVPPSLVTDQERDLDPPRGSNRKPPSGAAGLIIGRSLSAMTVRPSEGPGPPCGQPMSRVGERPRGSEALQRALVRYRIKSEWRTFHPGLGWFGGG